MIWRKKKNPTWLKIIYIFLFIYFLIKEVTSACNVLVLLVMYYDNLRTGQVKEVVLYILLEHRPDIVQYYYLMCRHYSSWCNNINIIIKHKCGTFFFNNLNGLKVIKSVMGRKTCNMTSMRHCFSAKNNTRSSPK